MQVVGIRRLPSLVGGIGISGTHVAGGSAPLANLSAVLDASVVARHWLRLGKRWVKQAATSPSTPSSANRICPPSCSSRSFTSGNTPFSPIFPTVRTHLLGDAQPLARHAEREGRLLVDHDPDGRDFAQSRVACQPVGMGGGEGAEVGLPRVVGAVAFLFQARRLIL